MALRRRAAIFFSLAASRRKSGWIARFALPGEVNEQEKRELLEYASALLFPIDWPEPFGLVMIESFCCGTPVIAYRNGSVPEVMEDGVAGFVVSTQEEAVRAARKIGSMDRRKCREVFELRFTAAHMAENYLRVYQGVLSG
jgi:glycosyltransferase involved in cell wall biosynthesis